MQVIKEEGAKPVKIWTDEVEEAAMTQLKNLARLPFIHSNGVAAMPDVHMGIGASVGTVIATDRAIIPAAVGVDIGCGMVALQTTLKATDLPESLLALRRQIERDVPLGAGGFVQNDRIRYDLLPERTPRLEEILKKTLGENYTQRAAGQIGSLGSGNHFIEICLDENQNVWVMLHSGSRGVGNKVGTKFIELAKKDMEKYFVNLPHEDLAYFPEDTDNFDDYVAAMQWCQEYALNNRKAMLEVVLAAMRRHIAVEFAVVDEAINVHHNYTERENHFGKNLWITRKGAIRARKDDLGIIPGSMGQRSYIVRGKGELQSYCSCSHGAGRQMSRGQARKRFTLTDLVAQTEGVECRKDDAVLDEIPGAYKNIDQVMANQGDLVEIVHTLKQIMCVKGA